MKSLRVAVIGGGPAGMEAALTATERGHVVTLYEKENVLGGALNIADIPDFKWPLRDYKNWLIEHINKSGVKVLLGTTATKELLAAEDYDAVIVAIGADPAAPPIPGVDGENVRFLVDIFGHENELKEDEKIVIIGGGEVGCETAMYLHDLGKKNVTVIEMAERLAPDVSIVHNYSLFVTEWEKRTALTALCSTKCTAITDKGVQCETKDGPVFVPADLVLLSTGNRSRTAEAVALGGVSPRYQIIGDCNHPGNVQNAVREGFSAALSM